MNDAIPAFISQKPPKQGKKVKALLIFLIYFGGFKGEKSICSPEAEVSFLLRDRNFSPSLAFFLCNAIGQ